MQIPSPARHWLPLLLLSAGLAALLEAFGVPAALLLGPMIAGIAVALTGTVPKVPRPAFELARAIIGCLIARSMPAGTFDQIGTTWPLLVSGVMFVILAAGLLGWMQSLWGSLPGTTALWGAAPGGASATILLAEAHGADVRLVALMQYLRVAGVAFTASVIAHFWTPDAGIAQPVGWFTAVSWPALGWTLAVAIASTLVAQRLKVPAGSLLGPMVACIVLSRLGLLTITLPPWLLAAAYTVIGWSIGLRFTRAILRQALRALPAILASTVTLIAVCAAFGMVLVFTAGLDPMTAYLAMSPGGADSIAIIAAASHVDLPLVMSMQTCRLIAVIVLVPPFTRFLAARLARRATPQS